MQICIYINKITEMKYLPKMVASDGWLIVNKGIRVYWLRHNFTLYLRFLYKIIDYENEAKGKIDIK